MASWSTVAETSGPSDVLADAVEPGPTTTPARRCMSGDETG